MKYSISYDLRKPGQDYDKLYKALEDFKAKRILQSQWVFNRYNTDAKGLRDYFKKYIDENDRLMVTCLDNNNWASWNVMTDINKI